MENLQRCAYSLAQAGTGVSVVEWIEMPLVELREWFLVIVKVKKEEAAEMERQMRKQRR